MPRPTNKSQLLEESYKQFKALLSFVNELSDEEKMSDFPEGTINRNIKDVLGHLHVWHEMMLSWYKTGAEGKKPEIPAKGYSWKTLPELNRLIHQNNKDLSYEKIYASFIQSYQEIRTLIESLSEEQLFEKNIYSWTGTTTLGAYLISATSSHYRWALTLIRKAKKRK